VSGSWQRGSRHGGHRRGIEARRGACASFEGELGRPFGLAPGIIRHF
jgi:hypothetical protein